MTFPRILIDQPKLLNNLNTLADLCHAKGMTLTAVGKGAAAHPHIMAVAEASRADMIGDSRLENLAPLTGDKPRLMLRIAMPSEVERTVDCCEISAMSEIETVKLLGRAAAKRGKRHKVMLMTDLGDLREGVFCLDRPALLALAQAVLEQPSLELYGLGVNLSCFSGVMPDSENMGRLIELAAWLRQECGVELPLVSGGATSNLESLLAGEYPVGPGGVTNLRIGEGWLVGYDSSGDQALETLSGLSAVRNEGLTLEAQLVEVQTKPSRPLGHIGRNAFGEEVVFEDKGDMRRGICALGRQDADLEGLTPLDRRIRVLGGSSDHTIVDLSDAPEYKVGDVLSFRINYGCMLRAFTSHYVDKLVSVPL